MLEKPVTKNHRASSTTSRGLEIQKISLLEYVGEITYGLVVRIRDSHARGRGSIPRGGTQSRKFFFIVIVLSEKRAQVVPF